MEFREWCEIRACLPNGRTLFHYERDWYAFMLLNSLLNSGWTAAEIRQSNFARLLEKPEIRDILARKGHLSLDEEDLLQLYLKYPIAWRLTIGRWGNSKEFRWNQTSRKGCNLVLQINFPSQHNALYRKLVSPSGTDYFNYSGHPVSRKEFTMSWVRLDIDMDTGEVLIEEIQSDWIRRAQHHLNHSYGLYRTLRRASEISSDVTHEQFGQDMATYVKQVMPVYTMNWQEISMAAALHFITQELGIARIFIHDFETGNHLKRLAQDSRKPPRSIYSSLPKKFCFQKLDASPDIINSQIKRITRSKKVRYRVEKPKFWHLSFEKLNRRVALA